jgi:hypothetical protein
MHILDRYHAAREGGKSEEDGTGEFEWWTWGRREGREKDVAAMGVSGENTGKDGELSGGTMDPGDTYLRYVSCVARRIGGKGRYDGETEMSFGRAEWKPEA